MSERLREDFSTYIQTYSGGVICPADPLPEEVRIEDIAHALALQVRFGGHIKTFYSVGQHSVLVSHHCDPQDALWGLLHDASEAYVADICRPVKKGLAGYAPLEAGVMRAVCDRFGLAPQIPVSVKAADDLLLRAEAHCLFTSLSHLWQHWPNEPAPFKVEPWEWAKAEEEFLRRFQELTGGKE